MTITVFVRKFRTLLRVVRCCIYKYTDQRALANELYNSILEKDINWSTPTDINEKINWMKFYSDTSEWSLLADKYRVRDFIVKRVGSDYLIPLLGVYDNVEDIDFSKLPDSFVLKTNNGAGSVLVITDKHNLDEVQVKKKLMRWLKTDFGRSHAEPHYCKIKPCIIAEDLLVEESKISSSLIDYKIWCFDGKPFGTWCCFNRKGFHADTEWHDLDWNFRPEWSIFTPSYKNGGGILPKPDNYVEMLNVASKLSKGFPEVRVDLYNINGKIYFGEMTFTCAGGHINFYSKAILDELGALTDLSLAKPLK